MLLAQGADWGSVPLWISTMLSGGSVLMALHIIRRDHKKDERADATKILCWNSDKTEVVNGSDRAIRYVRAVNRLKNYEGERSPFRVQVIADTLRPGGEAAIDRYWGDDYDPEPVAVVFYDSDGKEWARDLRTSRLSEHSPRRTLSKWVAFRIHSKKREDLMRELTRGLIS